MGLYFEVVAPSLTFNVCNFVFLLESMFRIIADNIVQMIVTMISVVTT